MMKGKNTALIFLLLAASVVLAGGWFYFGPGAGGGSESAGRTGDAAGKNQGATGGQEGEGFLALAAQTAKKTGTVAANPASPAPDLAGLENPRAREDYLNSVFRPLAGSGVDAAMARVRGLPDAASKDMAMLALLGEWTGQSVAELVQQGELGRFGVAGALALHLMREGKISPQQAASMADEFLSGSQRVGVLGRAAQQLAPTDPQAALAMGEGLTDWEQMRFLSRFASGWASKSPDEARAWAAQFPDERTRSVLMGRILGEEMQTNPAAAAQTFLQSPPEDKDVRVRTARQIASGWAGQDTLAAMQWADNLPTDTERNAARDGIRSAAPVGIGARITPGPDGLPVLQDFVPGSPASLSGQLRGGDRVLAVTDANGSWVNARNMPLRDVVRMIQGEPKTRVSLQVQSQDGSPQRVVTLGREQIIHRPGN